MSEKPVRCESKDLLRIFSRNARYICKNKGISIGELEEKVGVSKGYLSRLESSKKAMSLANLWKIAQILETSIDNLLNENMMIKYRIQELEEELKSLKKESGAR